jgi:hypothetical protein
LAFGAVFVATADFLAVLAVLAFGAAFFPGAVFFAVLAAFFAGAAFDDVDAFAFGDAFFAGAPVFDVLEALAFGAAFFAAGFVVAAAAAVLAAPRTPADDFFFAGFIFFPIEVIAPAAAVAASARISPVAPATLAITPFDARLVFDFFIFDQPFFSEIAAVVLAGIRFSRAFTKKAARENKLTHLQSKRHFIFPFCAYKSFYMETDLLIIGAGSILPGANTGISETHIRQQI